MEPSKESIASKQIKLFQDFKKNRFSGQLSLKNSRGKEWIFYLHLGRILYATGGTHPIRRWRRQLLAHLPQIVNQLSDQLSVLNDLNHHLHWEYDLLCLWIDSGKIDRQAAIMMIRAASVEIFFDLLQTGEITHQLNPQDRSPLQQLALIDAEQSIVEAWKIWQAWQGASLNNYSPDWAPVIQQPEQLQSRASEKTYQILTKLLDGKHTLRDLAILKQWTTVQITTSIMPYIHLGFVGLISIPDLPSPFKQIEHSTAVENDSLAGQAEQLLIACVDDSPLVCQTMEKIITAEGYRFVSENNSLQAIAVLLDRKPDFIFLDCIMPEINGYELCSQLRQLDCFRHTPIVIFTGAENLIDRVKAKMSGCSELLLKSLESKLIVDVISKYLHSKTAV